jgi:N-acetylglucosamine-6-sulfatase
MRCAMQGSVWMVPRLFVLLAALAATLAWPVSGQVTAPAPALTRQAGVTPRNIVLILADDHRADAMGFVGHPFLETPNLDRMAREGVHFPNAMVTTALCSPSRASILTGLYAHRHRVVDNNNPVPNDLVFFPQYLQHAGFQTAFVGKWHMGGDSDAPQRGFDHWVSFRGQGSYLPVAAGLNVNGKQVPQRGYITDELTDYAVEWLERRDRARPFFLYLSHKAVHSNFVPADRHQGRYAKQPVPPPASQDPAAAIGRPMWVTNQRNSWHGVDYPYHSQLDVAEYYRRYAETLLAVDDSLGRVLDALQQQGVLDNTLVLYMGDNGFAFGEQGLIDKRTAYETSMRIPMVARAPGLLAAGATIQAVVANIDVAPTMLEVAGLQPPAGLDGRSMVPLARNAAAPWREELLYEYYWERNFPQTPTIHALRGNRYKYIRPHGIWDLEELYDLSTDPQELRNLAIDPAHAQTLRQMNTRLFEILQETGGMSIPLYRDIGNSFNLRDRGGAAPAVFPDTLVR